MSRTPLQERILVYLQDGSAVATLAIAKACCGKKATKRNVNPALYALARVNLVEKQCDANGTRPRWTLIKEEPTTAEDVEEPKNDYFVYKELQGTCKYIGEDKDVLPKTALKSVIVRFPNQATYDTTADWNGDQWYEAFNKELEEGWAVDSELETVRTMDALDAELFGCSVYEPPEGWVVDGEKFEYQKSTTTTQTQSVRAALY